MKSHSCAPPGGDQGNASTSPEPPSRLPGLRWSSKIQVLHSGARVNRRKALKVSNAPQGFFGTIVDSPVLRARGVSASSNETQGAGVFGGMNR